MHISDGPMSMKKRHMKLEYMNFAEGSYFQGACLERSDFHSVQRLLYVLFFIILCTPISCIIFLLWKLSWEVSSSTGYDTKQLEEGIHSR